MDFVTGQIQDLAEKLEQVSKRNSFVRRPVDSLLAVSRTRRWPRNYGWRARRAGAGALCVEPLLARNDRSDEKNEQSPLQAISTDAARLVRCFPSRAQQPQRASAQQRLCLDARRTSLPDGPSDEGHALQPTQADRPAGAERQEMNE